MLTRCGLLLLCVPFVAAQSGGTVEGIVVDSAAGQGISGVTVGLAAGDSKSPERSAITDGAGTFRIAGLPPGDYTASYTKSGYRTALSGVVSGNRIHLGGDGDTQHVTVKLTQLGGVSGRVLDFEGHPFARMHVQLSTASQTSNMVLLVGADTDQDGRYRFTDMWPGNYTIEARPIAGSLIGGIARPAAPKKDEEKPPPLRPPPAPEGERRMWANTFYPGAVGRSQAARVAIRAGWELQDYDIRLQAVPVYRIAGVVVGEDGKRAAGVAVGIELADRWEHDSDGAKSREDGTFEFPAVHQGDWRLMATVQYGSAAFKGFAEATVARHDLENLALRLAAPFSVSGAVEWEPSPDGRARVPVANITLESATHSASETGRPKEDGTFRIENVFPDRYRVTLYGQAPGYYTASVLLGERDVLGQVVELAASPPPLRVICRLATGRLRGVVTDGAGATVVLLPKDEALLNLQYIRSTKSDAEGRYEIPSVRPGEYYALAFRAADVAAFQDADFVRPLLAQAVSVHVDNGAVVPADLKLTSWPE